MSYDKYLIELLREEVKEAEFECESLRKGLRYKIGEIILLALPISFHSFYILPKLFTIYKNKKQIMERTSLVGSIFQGLPESALSATKIGLGTNLEMFALNWSTTDEKLIGARLATGMPVETIVFRTLHISLVRQLAQLQLNGAKLIWWPDPTIEHQPELEAYVREIVDEYYHGELS